METKTIQRAQQQTETAAAAAGAAAMTRVWRAHVPNLCNIQCSGVPCVPRLLNRFSHIVIIASQNVLCILGAKFRTISIYILLFFAFAEKLSNCRSDDHVNRLCGPVGPFESRNDAEGLDTHAHTHMHELMLSFSSYVIASISTFRSIVCYGNNLCSAGRHRRRHRHRRHHGIVSCSAIVNNTFTKLEHLLFLFRVPMCCMPRVSAAEERTRPIWPETIKATLSHTHTTCTTDEDEAKRLSQWVRSSFK